MKCGEVEILLQLAADGEITSEERAIIEAHLDDCVVCRRKEAWLDFLAEHLPNALGSALPNRQELADDIIEQLLPRSETAAVEPSTAERKQHHTGKLRVRKRKLLTRIAVSLWTRRKRKRAEQREREEKSRGGWLDASVSALQPGTTSLDGFRAAKQGVNAAVQGPKNALKLVSGALPGRDRS